MTEYILHIFVALVAVLFAASLLMPVAYDIGRVEQSTESFNNGYLLGDSICQQYHDKETHWHLILNGETVFVYYPQGITDPFAEPRNYTHIRCINATWACTEKVCIAAKYSRLYDASSLVGFENLNLTPQYKIGSPEYYESFRQDFLKQGMTEEQANASVEELKKRIGVRM